LERELRKYGVSYNKAEKSGDLDHAANELRLQSADELLINVGYGKVLPADVAEVLVPDDKRKAGPQATPQNPIVKLIKRVTGVKSHGIKVAGEDDVLVRFARCCSPVPGDPIVGVITRGRGVTVHTKSCPTSLEQDEERRIEVEWDVKASTPRPVSVQVVCANRPGLLAQISTTFNEKGMNITQANCRSTDDVRATNTFTFSVKDLDQLHEVMRALQKIQGVFSVQRL
jgi:guanosine-3',5'-bis(diphosphate) 3'-pyrophosphohydrolase